MKNFGEHPHNANNILRINQFAFKLLNYTTDLYVVKFQEDQAKKNCVMLFLKLCTIKMLIPPN